MKKVLFISPTPTHPTNAGNRQHIKSLVSFFKQQDWETHFLYLAYEHYDISELRSYFGNNLYIIPRKDLFDNRKSLNYGIQKLVALLNRYKRKAHLYLHTITKEQYLYNSEVDSDFPRLSKQLIKQLQRKHHFSIVVCEYARISKALNYFDQSVFKIIDAHDKFTDRYQIYLKNNLKPSWVSLFKNEERKALKRADLIIALQEIERQYFQDLSGRKSVSFFGIPTTKELPKKPFERKLMYFASDNLVNIKTLQSFEEKVLPALKEKYPDVLLLVGGTICNSYYPKDINIQLLGLFDSPFDFYKLGDIAINPELEGTGFKIKTLEALCFGIPTVCTKAGSAGLTDLNNDHLLISESIDDFLKSLIEMIENDSLRSKTAVKAKEWVDINIKKNERNLLNHLGTINPD